MSIVYDFDGELEDELPEFDICLESDCYIRSEDFFAVKISKDIFDDYVPDSYIRIKFVDEPHSPVLDYEMIDEDDDWIYCEAFD